MRNRLASFVVLANLVAAGTVPGQIAMPAYSSTYTGSPRGFHFQAPKTFTVTHLMVPDEQKVAGGKQLVALFKLSAQPPACCPTNGTSTPVFSDYSTAPGQLIPVIPPVTYNQGDWFLVLGAVTATGRGGVSYGGAPSTPSTVLGTPVTLWRCGIQQNMQAAGAFATLWSSTSTTSIGRVRVYVAGQGRAEPYGSGSGAELCVSDPYPPLIGKRAELIVKPGTANNRGGLFAVGLQRASIPLPFGTVLMPRIFVLMPVASGPLPVGGVTIWFNIPNQPALSGAQLVFQGAVDVAGGPTLTNGVEWTINP